MKVSGEINGMRSLFGFYSPLISCTCTGKRARVVLVQEEEYRWPKGQARQLAERGEDSPLNNQGDFHKQEFVRMRRSWVFERKHRQYHV